MNLFWFLNKNIKSKSVNSETEKKIQSEWERINILLSGGQPSQLKDALITADKSLDNAMRDIFSGETMGERLKSAESKFDSVLYNKIWNAHKLRNTLVHESGFEARHFQVKEAVDVFKNALYILGIKV